MALDIEYRLVRAAHDSELYDAATDLELQVALFKNEFEEAGRRKWRPR